MEKNRTAYKNKFLVENYDRVSLCLDKGQKEIVKAAAERQGLSLNAYIVQAINRALEEDADESGL